MTAKGHTGTVVAPATVAAASFTAPQRSCASALSGRGICRGGRPCCPCCARPRDRHDHHAGWEEGPSRGRVPQAGAPACSAVARTRPHPRLAPCGSGQAGTGRCACPCAAGLAGSQGEQGGRQARPCQEVAGVAAASRHCWEGTTPCLDHRIRGACRGEGAAHPHQTHQGRLGLLGSWAQGCGCLQGRLLILSQSCCGCGHCCLPCPCYGLACHPGRHRLHCWQRRLSC
mmetsp:Transcript_13230/g.32343  ORF Transcript_13230/g.32343 Transcript_13230/m.32343 type:complete len:229 (-) Transcript_13230:273-959(-)